MGVGRIGTWLLAVAAATGGTGVALPGIALTRAPLATAADPPRVAKPAAPVPPEQLDEWIAALSSDQFVAREEATAKLIAAGHPVIAPLVARLSGASLETASRGIAVLRELSLSSDEAIEEAARGGLEKLAAPPAGPTSVSRRAQVVLDGLNESRQRRAADELSRLGAKIGVHQVQFGVQFVDSVYTIEFGPDWTGTDSDLRRLKWLVGVQHVKFIGTNVTDDWMKYLSTMKNLTTLTLKRTSVSEDGLAVIRELPKLQSFVVMYSPIGDRVIDHLLTVKTTSFVKIYGTKVSKEAAQKLKDAIGEKRVDYRRGGFLGVNCTAHPLGCEVSVVQPGTAAMDAGIESSDVILKYGPRFVESFETLTTHISENAPGDEVKLELVRNVRLRRASLERAEDSKLGITGKANALGIEVLTVEPNSLIAQMEIKVGDVITVCDEKRVRDMEQLEAAFDAAKVGERINIDLVRAPTIITKTVKLGEWE